MLPTIAYDPRGPIPPNSSILSVAIGVAGGVFLPVWYAKYSVRHERKNQSIERFASSALYGPGRFASALRGRLPVIALAGIGGVPSGTFDERLEFHIAMVRRMENAAAVRQPRWRLRARKS